MAILSNKGGAGHVTFEWDAAIDPAIVGYRLFLGTASGVYTLQRDVGNQTLYMWHGLPLFDANGNWLTYYAVAQGLDSGGSLIGAVSNEASGQVIRST